MRQAVLVRTFHMPIERPWPTRARSSSTQPQIAPPASRTITLALLLVLFGIPAVLAQQEVALPSHWPAEDGAVLIHYWNFDTIPNDVDFSTTGVELLDVSSRRYGAFLAYDGARWDRVNDPTPLNARETRYEAELDRALRLRNPAGALTLRLPTTGHRAVRLRYAASRTGGGGAERQQISYSLDGGATFTNAGLATSDVTVVADTWSLVEIDFSAIPGADDNRDFVVRLTMAGAGSERENTAGNHRLNNVTLDGYVIPDTGRSLIHDWNFNTIRNDVEFPTGTEIGAGGVLGGRSTVSGAWIRYDGARWDRVNDPTPLNARVAAYRADEDRAIRMRNPAGILTLRLPTVGHTDVLFRYVVKKSGSGAATQEIAYSTDGSTFVTTGLPYSTARVGESYILHVMDFSGIPAVNDNANFTIRITPSGAGAEPGNIEGNQRFDHITVDAKPAAGQSR